MANCGARFSGPALCPRSVDGKHKCCRVERHETKTWLPPEEVLVVDSLSTDGTPEMLRALGCRVISERCDLGTGRNVAVRENWKDPGFRARHAAAVSVAQTRRWLAWRRHRKGDP